MKRQLSSTFEKREKQVVKPRDPSSSYVAAPNEEVSEWKKESSHDFHRGVAQRDPPCSVSTDLTTSSLFFPTCLFPFFAPLFAPSPSSGTFFRPRVNDITVLIYQMQLGCMTHPPSFKTVNLNVGLDLAGTTKFSFEGEGKLRLDFGVNFRQISNSKGITKCSMTTSTFVKI